MKKFYAVLVVCLFLAQITQAQTYYWIGPSSGSGGNWSDNNNWSLSSGGAPVGAGIYPNNPAHNVIFDQAALVNVNLNSLDLLSLRVTTGTTAKIFVNNGSNLTPTINLFSTSAANPALKIETGARLEDSCDVGVPFTVSFSSNALGVVDGTWYFAGRSTVLAPNGATFSLPSLTGLSNRLDVNGTIQFRNNTQTPNPSQGEAYLFFNSGSTFWLDRNGGNSPRASWNANATIKVTGATSTAPSINLGASFEVGTVVFDCAGITPANFSVSLNNNMIIKGDLQVLNTNNKNLIIASNGSGIINDFAYTVNGNFVVSGNSRVVLANAGNTSKVVVFQVNGNLNLSGTAFDLQLSNNILSNTTTLKVKGNINHSAGTFGVTSTVTSTTTDLFVVEMNGTSAQTITSTGTMNNAGNELTLRLNNAAGVSLAAPLTVGKISWNSAAKGKLNTTLTNILTIANTGTHALIAGGADNTGFVNGPVRRNTAGTGSYILPTGKGSTYDPCYIKPGSATASVYRAEYFNTAFSDLSFVTPLLGVSNQKYWQIATISGSDAAVELTLTGAIPGASASDGVVVTHYNGTDWTDYSPGGIVISPGNATTGTARSSSIQQNGFYTFAYGIAGSLPIRLLQFDAQKSVNSSAQVLWAISTGSNAQLFEVLRSSDGRNFSTIGRVSAVRGKLNYSYTDAALATGTNYYRLRMTDEQGVVSYSQIVTIMNGAKGIFLTSMLPTVVQQTATLHISSSDRGTMQLVVTDMYGRALKQQQVAVIGGNQQVQLYFNDIPAGAYQITGYMNGSKAGTIRFVRQ